MANIREKDMARGSPLVKCNLCGTKLLGSTFFNKFKEGRLSTWQKIQIKVINKISASGAKILDMKSEESKPSTLSALLTLHLSRKGVRIDKPHALALVKITKEMDDLLVFKEVYTMDSSIITYLSSSESSDILVPSKGN